MGKWGAEVLPRCRAHSPPRTCLWTCFHVLHAGSGMAPDDGARGSLPSSIRTMYGGRWGQGEGGVARPRTRRSGNLRFCACPRAADGVVQALPLQARGRGAEQAPAPR